MKRTRPHKIVAVADGSQEISIVSLQQYVFTSISIIMLPLYLDRAW